MRELREETGIRVAPERIGPPRWRRRASFIHRRLRHVQDEVVVAVRLDGPGPDVDETDRLDYQREDYLRFPLVAGRRRRRQPGAVLSGPAARATHRFLAGDEIDEPFELFS